MRPSASIAARTSPPDRKTRTRPPKRSPPPANSSTPKHAATTCSPKRKQRPKSNGPLASKLSSPARSGRACDSCRRSQTSRSKRCGRGGFLERDGIRLGSFSSRGPDAAQQECCEPGSTLLCMGLFSRFLSSEQIDRTKTHLALPPHPTPKPG